MGDVVNLSGLEREDDEPQGEVLGADATAFEEDVRAFALALLGHRPELGLPENANLLADILTAFRDFDARKAGLRRAETGDHGELSDDSFHLSVEG
jgi:hypothetical protein